LSIYISALNYSPAGEGVAHAQGGAIKDVDASRQFRYSNTKLGDRSTVGQRTLTPSIQVRILVPQPQIKKGVRDNPFFILWPTLIDVPLGSFAKPFWVDNPWHFGLSFIYISQGYRITQQPNLNLVGGVMRRGGRQVIIIIGLSRVLCSAEALVLLFSLNLFGENRHSIKTSKEG
jgi:hypothetical protein